MMTMRMRYPNRSELLLIALAALTVASAVSAVLFWNKRGICLDSAVCATVSILSLVGIILLARRTAAVKRLREMSDRPVLLVMTSGPKKDRNPEPQIRGKMPEGPDH